MSVITVNRVVDKKRIIRKNGGLRRKEWHHLLRAALADADSWVTSQTSERCSQVMQNFRVFMYSGRFVRIETQLTTVGTQYYDF
jgi:hypothetical protein